MDLFFIILLGAVVGVILGLLGSGGSVLTVPLLIYVLHIPPKSAVAMSLVIVGLAAMIGFIQQLYDKRVCLKIGLFFGVGGIGGTYAGTHLARFFSGDQQIFIFAIIVLAASFYMLKQALSAKAASDPSQEVCRLSSPLLILVGVGIGVLTGLVGVGGGFLIIPVLTFGGMGIHRAIGTSLMIIVLNALAGVIGYLGKVELYPSVIYAFASSAAVTTLIGIRLGRNIPERKMKLGFASFLLILGSFILIQNQGVL